MIFWIFLILFGQLNAELRKDNDFCLCMCVFRYTTRTSINASAMKGTVVKADWENWGRIVQFPSQTEFVLCIYKDLNEMW